MQPTTVRVTWIAPGSGHRGGATRHLANVERMASEPVEIVTDGPTLSGDLRVPEGPLALVLFAHGSGSSRLSPRNQQVAEQLNRAGLATLLLDLLTPTEAVDRGHVFDIELLAERLRAADRWRRGRPDVGELPLVLFGASTGAAAALVAAADLGDDVAAVVSRGGRPDLAAERLADVSAPTLLVVGGADTDVIELNERALEQLTEAELAIVPGAGHLFEEPGAIDRVAELAGRWFVTFASRRA